MMSNRTHKAIVKGTNVLIATSNVLQHSEAADSFNECISKGEEDQLLAILDEMSEEQDAELEAMKAKNNEMKRLSKTNKRFKSQSETQEPIKDDSQHGRGTSTIS